MFRSVVILSLMIPNIGYTWGSIGHRVIGKIAEDNLKECAKPTLKKLLGKENMAEASIWADTVKSDPKRKFQNTWHWLNIPDGKKFTGQKTNPKGDAIWAIKHSLDILKGQKKDKRITDTQALKLLIHIVGDIHQPLHGGRASDKGGHDVNVYFFNRISALHVVWDTDIIDFLRLSYTELAESLSRRMMPGSWKNKSINSWINEAMEFRKMIYTFDEVVKKGKYKLLSAKDLKKKYRDIYKSRVRMPISSEPTSNRMGSGEMGRDYLPHRGLKIPSIRYGYVDRAVPVIEQRLYKAGIRLSVILNDMWCE